MEAELKKFLKIEEEFWRQKAGMKWFSDGDKNTKFFHSYVKRWRKNLYISEKENDQGVKVQTNAKTGEEAVNYFSEQFKEENITIYFSMLDLIEKSITEEENEEMVRLPEQDEVKRVVFELNGSSAHGHDGFSGLFFQICWEIVGGDIIDLPKYVTH
ncbi:hypothetical protein KY290_013471 [Solanum tuberosum]|uniref:Uncharacterized protein n=1 Tax=Solanum tuberosum TaxID=4113 RepID=A0ABQ7VMH1_SOLTU|nr:hypothetical protein KY289_013592 [Solanum tuberosum]KAH0716898.1 hypothetical protein KY285_012929 [Solanum tuberosum]KAH0769490.1 hypothetical protein KY290_013471 [Solanum tuberosum]